MNKETEKGKGLLLKTKKNKPLFEANLPDYGYII